MPANECLWQQENSRKGKAQRKPNALFMTAKAEADKGKNPIFALLELQVI